MTKRTYNGVIGMSQGFPVVFINGRDWYFPDFDFKGIVGQTVRVSIEVEPVTMKDIIAKIFANELLEIERWDYWDRTPTGRIMRKARDQVLAAIAELDRP